MVRRNKVVRHDKILIALYTKNLLAVFCMLLGPRQLPCQEVENKRKPVIDNVTIIYFEFVIRTMWECETVKQERLLLMGKGICFVLLLCKYEPQDFYCDPRNKTNENG